MGLLLISVPFGAIHLAAWNYTFPTQIDRDVWRSAAIVITTATLAFLGAVAAVEVFSKTMKCVFGSSRVENTVDTIFGYLVAATVIIYTLSRLALIVEMFRCLLYLPPDAYLKTWASNIPHFG